MITLSRYSLKWILSFKIEFVDTSLVVVELEFIILCLIFRIISWLVFWQRSNFSEGLIEIPLRCHRLYSIYLLPKP